MPIAKRKPYKYKIDFSPENPPVVGQRVLFNRKGTTWGEVTEVQLNWTRQGGQKKGQPINRIYWRMHDGSRAVSMFRAMYPTRVPDPDAPRRYRIDFDEDKVPPIGYVLHRIRFYDPALEAKQRAEGALERKKSRNGKEVFCVKGSKVRAGMRTGSATLVGFQPHTRMDGRQTRLLVWRRDDGWTATTARRTNTIQWKAPPGADTAGGAAPELDLATKLKAAGLTLQTDKNGVPKW